MKIIHTADLHLGKLYKGENFEKSKQRREEIWESFKNLINFSNENNIELILISGDLYEREYFTINDFKRLSDLLSQTKANIYIIGGNHDHIDDGSLILSTEFSENVHIFRDEDYFEYKNIRIYGKTWDKQFGYKSDLNFKLDKSFKNLLMLHCSVGFDSHFPIKEEILNSMDFDYIALGHFHGHKQVAENAYYSGSLEPLKFRDEGSHGFYVYDLDTEEQKFIKMAKRSYNIFEYDVTNKSVNKIKEDIEKLLNAHLEDFNKLILKGISDNTKYIMELIEGNYYYLKIEDETKFAVDYSKIAELDSSGIISNLIEQLNNDEKAIKYGIEALLETANED